MEEERQAMVDHRLTRCLSIDRTTVLMVKDTEMNHSGDISGDRICVLHMNSYLDSGSSPTVIG